jgi:hypothetical protein
MTDSYAMIDPLGRFYGDTNGRHVESAPILDVRVCTALAQVEFRPERLVARGGLYAWDRPHERTPLTLRVDGNALTRELDRQRRLQVMSARPRGTAEREFAASSSWSRGDRRGGSSRRDRCRDRRHCGRVAHTHDNDLVVTLGHQLKSSKGT